MAVLSNKEWTLIAAIVAADRITKIVAHAVRPDNFFFSYVRNTGAGFGIFQNQNAILAFIAALALVVLYFALRSQETYKGHERTALVVFGAGIMGNLWDRVQYQYVIDFIGVLSPTGFPVFNIADSAISLSVAYLVAMSLRNTYAGWAFRSKLPTNKSQKPSGKFFKKK